MEKKTIGIIGGMGPLATVDLFQKIAVHTRASCDQDHLHILIDNDPSIEDRTAALLSGGADPTPKLAAAARNLERGGAELLLIPCNTAHCFYDAVQAAVNVPVLHMIRVTAQALRARGVRRAGLLSTTGTIRTGIYQDCFAGTEIDLLVPGEEELEVLMDAIYRIKAGEMDLDDSGMCAVAESLLDQGAETLILGCTELPLMPSLYRYPVTDPTLELALEAVRQAGGEVV